MNNHQKVGLEVLGDTLRAVVQRYVEQPLLAYVELHKPMSGDVGRGWREAVRARRDDAPFPEAPGAVGAEEHRALDQVPPDRLILLLPRALPLGRDGEQAHP